MSYSRPVNGRGEYGGWIVAITHSADYLGIRVDIGKKEGGKLYRVQPLDLVLEEHKPGTLANPALNFDPDQTEALMHALYAAFSDAGISPEPESFTKGKLEATERHLDDMRKLANLEAIATKLKKGLRNE